MHVSILCLHILTQPQSFLLVGTSAYETEADPHWLPQEKAEQTDGPSLECQPTRALLLRTEVVNFTGDPTRT